MVLTTMTARHEQIVELLLLIPSLLLLIGFSLLFQHVCQRFAIAVGGLVHLHLPFRLKPQKMETVEQSPLHLFDRLRPAQIVVQLKGRDQLLHGFFPRLLSVDDLSIQLFKLARCVGFFELNLFESAFLTLLRVLPNQKHGRKWELKGHS
jgi:hypothetical protein